jgi:hypothetical protein
MKLKSFGCSFIWGSDLPDAGYGLKDYSKLTWPALLAQKFGWGYECHAKPGQGNLFIAKQILAQLQLDNEPAIFVINWTWIDRFDYVSDINDNDWKSVAPAQWEALRPGSTSSEAIHYYKNIHSQYRDKLTSLMQMYVCIQELERRGIPYISCSMDFLIYEKKWHYDPSIKLMQDYLQPRSTTFQGSNCLEWSKGKGYPISSNWHLLEAANQACAEYLESKLSVNKIQTVIGVPFKSVQV